jgi:hypothetical protein
MSVSSFTYTYFRLIFLKKPSYIVVMTKVSRTRPPQKSRTIFGPVFTFSGNRKKWKEEGPKISDFWGSSDFLSQGDKKSSGGDAKQVFRKRAAGPVFSRAPLFWKLGPHENCAHFEILIPLKFRPNIHRVAMNVTLWRNLGIIISK